jgi:hypothetical protein
MPRKCASISSESLKPMPSADTSAKCAPVSFTPVNSAEAILARVHCVLFRSQSWKRAFVRSARPKSAWRALHARRVVARDQRRVAGFGVEPLALAQPAVPVVADRHVADLVAQDDVQDLHRAQRRACRPRSLAWICGVASSPRASSVRGTSAMRATTSPAVFSHIIHRPSWPGSRRTRGPVLQVVVQQREVVRLLGGHPQPVAVEGLAACRRSARPRRARG